MRQKMSAQISRFKRGLGLSILFSLAVFTILAITALILGGIIILAYKAGALEITVPREPFIPILMPLMISVILGTVVAMLMSNAILKPIRSVIKATNQLASGDFSARIHMTKPPEMAELSNSFNRMAEELGSTELLRADFVNNFSHEFKTPIVSIKGFAEMLKHSDLTEQERDEYLDIVISEASRLSTLATNVLNLTRIENQAILTEQIEYNVGEQIRKTIILLQSNWEAKDLEITVDGEDFNIVGNEELLGQVWLNLLDNAIKFSRNGGSVSVSMSQQPTSAKFSVINNGQTISKEAQLHIFDKFYQGDTSHTEAGNGLGLTLVKKIVELHDGSISCNSDEAGTDFTITLPVVGKS